MKFLRAETEDLEEIYSLFRSEVELMNTRGNFQWNSKYPSKDDFRTSLLHGNLYLLRLEKEIAGMAVLDEIQDPAYENVNWQFIKTVVLHRFIIPEKYRRQAVGRQLLSRIEGLARTSGYQKGMMPCFLGGRRGSF